VFGVEVLGTIGVYVWQTLRDRRRRDLPIALAVLVVAGLALLEFAGQQFGLDGASTAVLHIGMPFIFVAVGLHLMLQYGRALQAAEAGRDTLQERIRDAMAEAERNFAQLAELRVEQVTERERKRIAADLHDDLGAKLLTIVHTSESDRISTLAREALEEMRLSVRGLTGKPVRLIDALGDWRAEVVSRLQQAGIEADWQAPADELPQTLSARAYVQTTRILREAVNNIIKHSGASRCQFEVAISDGDFRILIQDNGKGIPLELDGRLDRGHGMSSMKHRAKQLQGQCLVESGPGYGTVIRLTLPLDRHVQPA
jgi:two-component system sensor histidine kinase UhpB